MSIKSNIKTFSNVNLTLTTVYGYMNELLKIFIIMGQGVASGFDMFEYDLESRKHHLKIRIQFVVEIANCVLSPRIVTIIHQNAVCLLEMLLKWKPAKMRAVKTNERSN